MSKSGRLSRLCERFGITRLLELAARDECLVVIAYHRIGRAEETIYDPGVVGLTSEQFEQQLAVLKRYYRIVTLQESLEFIFRPSARFGIGVLLTFDDGYLDNYNVAFPILRAHGVQGTFFLSTSFVGTLRVPWWDQIAFLLSSTKHTNLELSYPRMKLDLSGDRKSAIRCVLRAYKSEPIELAPLLSALQRACEVDFPERSSSPLFLNWEQAAEMLAGGMAFGSHGHSHDILAKLSPEQQYEDLARSRAILSEKLNIDVDTLSYPIGGQQSFSANTICAAQRAGYRAAFSFYGSINFRRRKINPLDIRRMSPYPDPGAVRLQLASAILKIK